MMTNKVLCLAQMMFYLTRKWLRKSQYYFTILYPRIHRNYVFFTSKAAINSAVSHEEDAVFCYKCEIFFRKETQLFILERQYRANAHQKSSLFLGLLI